MKWDNNEKESKVLREPPEGDLKSNYIDKGKSYYKGISLSGLVTKKSPLKC